MNQSRLPASFGSVRLPQPPAPPVSLASFVFCPVVLMPVCGPQMLWQAMVYRAAFETAQAVVRPSLPERDLLAVWN